MHELRPKVSSLVARQLPEHIRNEQPAFVAFLEAYYRYIEQNEKDLVNLRDLDETLDSFVIHFKNELAQNLPYSEVDERFLLKHIKDLYLSKGSEASFDLLFKILFNKPVTVEYPSKQMLRASDGKWNQDISVFVEVIEGNPNDIVGKLVDVITPNKIIRVLIDRRQYVEVEVERAIRVSDTIYELILDRRFFGDINVGDRLRYRDDYSATPTYFSGDILATTATLAVEQAGTGFKLGEIYDIRNFDGYGSKMKISKVDTDGGIVAAQFIKYGIGYSTEFTTTIIPNAGQAESTVAGTSVLRVLNNLSITDRMGGFSEKGTANYHTYFDLNDSGGYADGTYVGEVVREFGITTTDAQVSTETPAIISVGLGAIANYPGYYINNDGFLDDAIYIQDSFYYQAFSYLIKIDETLDRYQSTVKNLIHPAGMALFGEYDIRNDFDVSLELESLIKILNITAQDELFTTEDMNFDNGAYLDTAFGGESTSFSGIQKVINTHLLNNGSTADNNVFSLTDTAGSLTTRTNPSFQLSLALYNGEFDYDGNVAAHTISLTSDDLGVTGALTDPTDQTKYFTKRLNYTSSNYDGDVDTNSFYLVDTAGSNSTRTNPDFEFSKSLSTNYSGVTELPNATMADGSYRFGLSVIDMDKELTDTPVISEYLTFSLTMDDFTDSVTPTDDDSFLFTKLVNGSELDYDDNATDHSVTMLEDSDWVLNKPLSDSQTVTEVSQTSYSGGVARFGISVIDVETSLETSTNAISDTDAADASDLNRTVPSFEVTFSVPGTHDVTFNESGIINKNPYAEAGFFLNDGGVYVSDSYTTF